jgi:hypothetical protein
MRASHADREAVAQRLRVGFDEGRLTVDEFDERLAAAYAAVTYGDLVSLTRDLPGPEQAVVESVPAAPPVPRRRDVLGPWRGWLAGNVFFVAIWAWVSIAADHPVTFFPAFFMLFSAAGVCFTWSSVVRMGDAGVGVVGGVR